MPDLLLELFSEEIPARMQKNAADTLKKNVTDRLVDAGLLYEGAISFVTSRRLTLHVAGLPVQAPDIKEERKGPRIDAPQKAIDGFLRSAGLRCVDEATIEEHPKKGAFYVAHIEKRGQKSEALLKEILEEVILQFLWPKSMRWGQGSLKWVRPLHSILCVFGPETEDPVILDVEVENIKASNVSYGHRFMAPEAFEVRRLEDYQLSLQKAHVILERERRMDIIYHDAKELAFARGLELVDDKGLLEEVAGLVEWPKVLMGSFDPSFLSLPDEVIRTAIRVHQKCFVLQDGVTGALSNHFLLVSNIEAKDGGKAIIAGNERVVSARLSDARFFWESDLNVPLEKMAEKLSSIIFHEKLGTQAQRTQRIVELSQKIASFIGADIEKVCLAAKFCKADLVSEMVGEFPDLQGLMGRFYAQNAAMDKDVCLALQMHYKPQGVQDSLPQDPISVAVALAEKLDMLLSFWSIDEKPTGSKDPYALRRAALGIIRIVLEHELSISLQKDFGVDDDLMPFFADRLSVQLKNEGVSHDQVASVFALEQQDDLLRLAQRARALRDFLSTDDGQSLLAGFKRAANILAKEEKKDQCSYKGEVDETLLKAIEEHALYQALISVNNKLDAPLKNANYTVAMTLLSSLRVPVDHFFEKVMVNDANTDIRTNRLHLLNMLREATLKVADFSYLEG